MPWSAAGFAFRLPFAHDCGVLTRRQKQLLDYLRRYIDARGYAPTLAEIGRHLRLGSVATVHKHLRNLERRGVVRRLPHRSRALELVAETRAVAVGAPIEPVEVRETVALPEELLGRGETFALRVRGDSMVGDGILDGDLIVVEARPDAPDGATVVALVDGEATVKRLYRERGGRVRLMPANERLAPLVAAADRVQE